MKAPWTSRQDEKMIKRKGEWSERRKRDYIAGCTTNVADDDKMIDDVLMLLTMRMRMKMMRDAEQKKVKRRKKEEKDIYNILLTQLRPPIYKTLFRDV